MDASYRWAIEQLPRYHGLRSSTGRMRPEREAETAADEYDLVVHFGVIEPDTDGDGIVKLEHYAPRYGYTSMLTDNCDELMPVRNVDAAEGAVDRGFVGEEWDVTTIIDGQEQVTTTLDIESVARTLTREAGFRVVTNTEMTPYNCAAACFASMACAERNRRLGRKAMHVAWCHIPECAARRGSRLTLAERISRSRSSVSVSLSITSSGSWLSSSRTKHRRRSLFARFGGVRQRFV